MRLNCRSPGGTPIREKPKTPPPVDAASMIAAALKKRFAKIQCDSPEKEADSSADFNSSPETTPSLPRKSRREEHEKACSPKALFSLKKSSPTKRWREEEKPSLPIVSHFTKEYVYCF